MELSMDRKSMVEKEAIKWTFSRAKHFVELSFANLRLRYGVYKSLGSSFSFL